MPQSETPREAVAFDPPHDVCVAVDDALDAFCTRWQIEQLRPCMARNLALSALRSLPPAAKWQLIGWLAEGLEPTREMVIAGAGSVYGEHETRRVLARALAAAREATDVAE